MSSRTRLPTFSRTNRITRAHTGDPNVFVSRENAVGEAADTGKASTPPSEKGARGTGLTIRFTLDPDAREGRDFIYKKSEGYVVVLNSAR